MAKAKEAEGEAPEAKSSKKGIVLWIVLTVLLIAGAVTGTLFYAGVLPPGAAAVPMASGETPMAVEAQKPLVPAMYTSLDPPFVMTYEVHGEPRFVQVSASVMARSAETIELVDANIPRIRHALIMLLGEQTYDELGTLEGKKKLRTAVLDEIRQIVRQEGQVPDLEDVFFTNFVMQ